MEKNSNEIVYVSDNQGSHFDLCRYCRNCNDCIDKHWKFCRPWLDRKALKEHRPICYR